MLTKATKGTVSRKKLNEMLGNVNTNKILN